jgi:hypothetical protein
MCGKRMRRAWSGKTSVAWICGDAQDAYRAERERVLDAVDAARDRVHLRIVEVAK